MRVSALKYTALTVVTSLITVILFLMPFHAFLTVWISTATGHYTALRLWKEAILVLCMVGVLYLLLTDHKIRSHTLTRRLVWLIILYGVLQLVLGALALQQHRVSLKALGYGWIVNLRFLAFFLVTWAIAIRSSRLQKNWQKIVLLPAVVVVGFGLVQEFFLTPRFLEHFGYSMFTILPFQYVDNQAELLRIQSTLRGANPLGAYLVVVLSVVLAIFFHIKSSKRRLYLAAFGVAGFLALFFTYSRSAWVGTVLSIAIVSLLSAHIKVKKAGLIIVASLLVVSLGAGIVLKQSKYVQDAFLHTSHDSRSPVSSNGARASALRSGIHDVVHEPLGRGPGTAGQASVYNNHPARISENYFIQIGQEVGWLGLGLFVVINAGVGYLLWLRRDNPLALSLFASLIGLTFVNLLSHAWADDTLAYLWWGLAGIAMVKHDAKKS